MLDCLPFDPPLPPPVPRRCTVCGGARTSAFGQHEDAKTYVMQRQGWVKIGLSKHPLTRLKELRAINRQCYIITPDDMDCTQPILLIGLLDGDAEHALHERWSGCHAVGEWFLPDGPMNEWLRSLTT